MRHLFILFFVSINLQTALAQNKLEQFKTLSDKAENTGLHSGELDSATCVQMLRIAQELKNDSLLAISYNLIGEYVSRIKGDNTAGLEYFFKAIPLAEKSNDKRRLSSIYFDMALIYFNLQNNEESVTAIRKGGENLPDKSHPLYDFMLAQYQRGMAIYFVFEKQPDSALAYAQQLMQTSRKIKSPLFEFSAGYLNAAAYAEQGDMDLAETWFKKGTALSDSLNSPYAVLRFAAIYIPFLISNHQLTDAKKQAQHLFSVGEKLDNNDLKVLGAGFMRQLSDSSNNIDSAYYYSRMEAVTNAEIFNQNNINKIQVLAFNEQIRQIDEEAKQKAEKEERRQNIQYALIALGIIIFISVFLLLSRTVIVNERLISFFAILGLLIVFEFINLLIHPWLAHFTHESPVLMLLALVAIAALLIPMHHRLEHWIKEKMVEKNKAIRLAAAKKTIEKLEKEPSSDENK
jgi:tetratricopeptide (TPR) repeat protein